MRNRMSTQKHTKQRPGKDQACWESSSVVQRFGVELASEDDVFGPEQTAEDFEAMFLALVSDMMSS